MEQYYIDHITTVNINEERCAQECPQRIVVDSGTGTKDYYCCLSAKPLLKTAGDGDTIRCSVCIEHLSRLEDGFNDKDYAEIANKIANQLEFFDKDDIDELIECLCDLVEDFEIGRYRYVRADKVSEALKKTFMDDPSLAGQLDPGIISKATDHDYSLIQTVRDMSDMSDDILGDFVVGVPKALDIIIQDIVWRECFREYFDPDFGSQHKFNHTGVWYYAYRVR